MYYWISLLNVCGIVGNKNTLFPLLSKREFDAIMYLPLSIFLCSSSHIRCLEIFDKPRNCRRTWNTLVVPVKLILGHLQDIEKFA